MKKRLLIYAPANYRNVEQQSQAELFIRNGYEVYLLTWLPEGPLHENFRELGAKAFVAQVKGRHIFFLVNQARYLSKFCREHKIDYVISHSQGNAFCSGIAHFFMKAKVFYFRHNSDYYSFGMSYRYRWANRWANRLSKYFIAPSRKVKEALIKEGVAEKKIFRINNCYDFSQYWKDTKQAAPAIREKYNAELLLLSVSRLDPFKRHLMAFEAVKKLVEKGVDVKLVSIGDGPMRDELEKWIRDNKLESRIFLEPFQTNTVDYYQACDMLIHLSYSEASCNVTKEAATCDKTVVVCRDVGDFDDYMEHGVNAFIVDKEKPVDEVVALLLNSYKDKQKLTEMGKALHKKVETLFSIEAVEKDYMELMEKFG